jgi:quercetin dioxygenase-like cupin family protein
MTRIHSDSVGGSHFSDEELIFELVDFAPPAPPISVSKAFAAEKLIVISSAAGWYGDWHPAPGRQLMFCLSGILEVEVSDGEVRRFGPGSVILVEDTTGKGHVSRVVGDERSFMVAAPLR